MSLKSLNDQIKICTKCPLSQKIPELCTPVCGIGNYKAKIMMITDCPRDEEVLLGEPISLKEQIFLFNIIPSKYIYITNLVKCNPKNNTVDTQPRVSEIKQCRTWVDQEINKVNPEVILAAGRKTADFFIKTAETFDKRVGKEYIINGRIIIPCYSVKHLLNRSKKDVVNFTTLLRGLINEQSS